MLGKALSPDTVLRHVSSVRWTFAKTYAKFCPHWWTTKDRWEEEDFWNVVRTIHERGELDTWRGRQRRYLRPGDGFEYWVMDSEEEIAKTVLINRGAWPRNYES